MSRTQTEWFPLVCLTLAMMLWASSFIAFKLAIRTYDPFVVTFGRMAVASFCFLFLFRNFNGNKYQKGDVKYILFMALCEPCLYFLFEAKAIENTSASQAGMVTAMLPLMVAVGARLFLGEVIRRKTLAGFVLAVIGVCWLSLGSEASVGAPRPVLGNLLEFAAMVCATGYTLTLKKLSARYNPLFLTAMQAFIGSLFFLPGLWLAPAGAPTHFELVPVLSIVYLGVFITVGAYGLYNYGVSRIPANQASAFVNLIPVFTLVLGWLLLGERFNSVQYLGAMLVFMGVFLSQSKSAPAKILLPAELAPTRGGGAAPEFARER